MAKRLAAAFDSADSKMHAATISFVDVNIVASLNAWCFGTCRPCIALHMYVYICIHKYIYIGLVVSCSVSCGKARFVIIPRPWHTIGPSKLSFSRALSVFLHVQG